MVICIRLIESEAWVICLVESFGLESRLVCTKVWDAWGGSEEAVCYTDIPPKSLLHNGYWFDNWNGDFYMNFWLSFSLWFTHCPFTQIFELLAYWRNDFDCWELIFFVLTAVLLQCTCVVICRLLLRKGPWELLRLRRPDRIRLCRPDCTRRRFPVRSNRLIGSPAFGPIGCDGGRGSGV